MFKALRVVSGGLLLASLGCGTEGDAVEQTSFVTSGLAAATNDYGVAATFRTDGTIDLTNPFFQALGTNPRTCATCHGSDQGWTDTGDAIKSQFKDTAGLGPIFNLVDNGISPTADVSTRLARRATFAPSIDHALTRFTRTIAATAEFTVAVSDPSGFSTPTSVLNFRRPTPTANESLVSSVLWTSGPTQNIDTQLQGLMRGAAQLHEQRDPANPVPTDQQVAGQVFMKGIFFAQAVDNIAGPLDADGAMGGPANLANQTFYLGINDVTGGDPMGKPFTNKVFDIYDAWSIYAGNNGGDCRLDRRGAIFRGQQVFNNQQFQISGVVGFNDVMGQDPVIGTCSSCHNVPNVGGHSNIRMMDIGTADPPNCDPALPLLTLTNKTTGAVRVTCELGRGTDGVWADVARVRVPPLRGLAARAPYFHDGQAKNIKQTINYHDGRFNIGLTRQQRLDLEAFLGAL
jgi:hypothetical protein